MLHIARPSRSVLEAIRERWEKENGSVPPGNDGGEVQHRWENALDVKPMMTGECGKNSGSVCPVPAGRMKSEAETVDIFLLIIARIVPQKGKTTMARAKVRK